VLREVTPPFAAPLYRQRTGRPQIEGLDHYCEWLNVSIGRSNYLPFVLLVALGNLQAGR